MKTTTEKIEKLQRELKAYKEAYEQVCNDLLDHLLVFYDNAHDITIEADVELKRKLRARSLRKRGKGRAR